MKTNPRTEKIAFLKGLINGTRSIGELINTQSVFLLIFETDPPGYFIAGRSSILAENVIVESTQMGRIELTEAGFQSILSNPRFNTTVIRIKYT